MCARQALYQVSDIPNPHEYAFEAQCVLQYTTQRQYLGCTHEQLLACSFLEKLQEYHLVCS